MIKAGFIGLGHMGNPMVMNLIKAKYDVKVFDINADMIRSCIDAGATAASSPADVATHSDVVFTSLQTGEQVHSVCLGDQGIFHALDKNALFIDCSSIAIGDSRALHEKAKELNIAMLDAPVSGGVKAAEAGTLTFMVGGDEKNFKRAEPHLKNLGQKIVHAGAPGNGQVAKICNNMMLAIQMVSVSEGFKLGEKLGIDPKVLFEICSNASSQCWSMTKYCPMPGILDGVPSNSDYKPGFTSAMMEKDLKLSQDAAKLANMHTPLGQLVTELYHQFNASGHEQVDFSGIIKLFDSH